MKRSLKFWRRTVQVGVAVAFMVIPYLNVRRIHTLSGNFLSFNAAGLPLADPLAVAQVGLKSGHVTGDLLLGAGIALALALTLGTVFCSWVCPFGLLSEWVHAWSRRLLPRGYRGLAWRGDGFRLRIMLFGGALAWFLLAAGGPVMNQLSLPGWYSRAFQMYVAESYVTPAVLLIMGVLALEFMAKSRFWCRYVCPQAVLLIVAQLLNPWRLRVVYEPERCICQQGSDPCRDSCPLDLAPKRLKHPWERECNNCGDCYVTCGKLGGALRFRLGPGRRQCNAKNFWLGKIRKAMQDFHTLLRGSAEAHGHLCPGQVIGVRLAMLGCSLIGLDDPASPEQIKHLLVYVEIDRCATDAIAYVTGAKLGRRSLKFVDHGIMAATFVNLKTGKAFRIVSREDSRELAAKYAPEIKDPHRQQLIAYQHMSLEELFTVEEVAVEVPASDLPGPARHKAVCQACGQVVRDKREVVQEGRVLCRPCAFGTYYRPLPAGVKE